MYNKRVLSTAVSELGKAKAPAKKRDIPVSPEKISRPFVSNDGYKQGPPPPGKHYRILSDTLYNPTPYRIKAVSDNNITQYLEPGDTTNKVFHGAKYVDEYPAMRLGGNRGTNRALFYKKGGEKKYSRSLEAKNRLFTENLLFKKKKSKKKKIFDPNARYFKNGGVQEDLDYLEAELTPEEIQQYRDGGYIIDELPIAQTGIENKTRFPNIFNKKIEKSVVYTDENKGANKSSCPEGQEWDEALGSCVIIGTQELPTMYASANPETNKKRIKFLDKANALWDTVEGRRVWMENAPKNYSLNELSKFVHNVKDYKKQAEVYEKYRRMAKDDEISGDEFARLYNENNWARFDQNTGRENFKGEYQQAVDEANKRKEANYGVTDYVLGLTGAKSLKNVVLHPVETFSDLGQTIVDVGTAIPHELYDTVTGNPNPSNINPLTGQEYWSGARGAYDLVSTLATVFNGLNSTKAGSELLTSANDVANTAGKNIKNATVGTVKASQKGLGTIRQGLDTPLSNLLTKKGMQWQDEFGNITTQWTPGAKGVYSNMLQWASTPSNILKTQTAYLGLSTLPQYIDQMSKDVDEISKDPTKAEAYVDMLYHTVKQGTDISPLMGRVGNSWYGASAPLYLGHNAKDAYDKNDLISTTRGLFNITSLPRLLKKEGGDTDINKHRQLLRDWTYGADIGMLQEEDGGEYWEDEIDEPTRQRLLALGYQVEDLD